MFNIVELQKQLIACALPPGVEDSQGALLTELARPYVDEIWEDPFGNIICHKRGTGKRLMIPAHRDVIGFMVTYIDPKGFIRFTQDGHHNPAYLQGLGIRFENGLRGTIQFDDTVDMSKPASSVTLSNLYIDIGAKDYEEAVSLVQPGDVAVFDSEAVVIAGNNMMTPYADDLIGCIVVLLAMEQLAGEDSPNDLYFVFSAQEERGALGAKVAAQHLLPDMGIAIDITHTGDTPRETVPMAIRLGKGPTIKIRDGLLYSSPEVVEHLRCAAMENHITWQDEILPRSGTDASLVRSCPGGAFSGAISIPTRGAHTQGEIFNLDDVTQAGRLLAAACMREF